MAKILLLHDPTNSSVQVEALLKNLNQQYTLACIEDVNASFILASGFNLLICELNGKSSACADLLEKINTTVELSGSEKCATIVIAKNSSTEEQIIRSAHCDFFFVKPISEQALNQAINQAISAIN